MPRLDHTKMPPVDGEQHENENKRELVWSATEEGGQQEEGKLKEERALALSKLTNYCPFG